MDLPTHIGPYRVLGRIGHGGMAEVMLAVAYGASGFEKRVALKRLLPEHRGDGELERLLIEEARLGARLEHQHLVGVHDLGVDEEAGGYYVRMDFVDGRDVASLPRPPLELALSVCHAVAAALAYLHRAHDLGLVHRDVSPSNILVSRAGEVRLGDLGLAKATRLADVTRGARKGKYAYMSPEQVASERLGPASDQFALGVTLFELATGRRPYEGDTPLATMELVRAAAPVELTGIPEDVASIVRRCLARAPADRFAAADELEAALAETRRARPTASARALSAWVTG
jgi:serine/threonine-protein kinase